MLDANSAAKDFNARASRGSKPGYGRAARTPVPREGRRGDGCACLLVARGQRFSHDLRAIPTCRRRRFCPTPEPKIHDDDEMRWNFPEPRDMPRPGGTSSGAFAEACLTVSLAIAVATPQPPVLMAFPSAEAVWGAHARHRNAYPRWQGCTGMHRMLMGADRSAICKRCARLRANLTREKAEAASTPSLVGSTLSLAADRSGCYFRA